jgi:hypothetical protein
MILLLFEKVVFTWIVYDFGDNGVQPKRPFGRRRTEADPALKEDGLFEKKSPQIAAHVWPEMRRVSIYLVLVKVM